MKKGKKITLPAPKNKKKVKTKERLNEIDEKPVVQEHLRVGQDGCKTSKLFLFEQKSKKKTK